MKNRGKIGNNNLGKGQEQNGYVSENGSPPIEAKYKSCKCDTSNGLHHFECLPSHLRFNKYIHNGYRLDLSTWECIKSLFYLHNETFNVYSHGLATIGLILLSPYFYSKITLLQFNPFLFPIHHITCITCVLFSTIYHLMMNHKGDSDTYWNYIMLDYIGIWMVTGCCCITFLKATFFCFPRLHLAVVSIYFVLALVSLLFTKKGTNAKTRMFPMICLGVLRLLAIYPLRLLMRSLGYTTGHLGTIWYLLGVELVGLLGGMINLSRLPERWYEGKVDYWFNSHNIMHLVVLIAPAPLHFGTVMDFEWMEKAVCPM